MRRRLVVGHPTSTHSLRLSSVAVELDHRIADREPDELTHHARDVGGRVRYHDPHGMLEDARGWRAGAIDEVDAQAGGAPATGIL